MEKYIKNTVPNELCFISYCVEIYKQAKNMKGSDVSALFHKYNVWKYIYDCYGALHTTGSEYTVEDIDLYIANRTAAL
ncbi:MAG: DUF3791 domain-containing protein [Clostridiales bacterium]|nr:DUF3791 domain-containing protein [Clostridiales bacterium]